MAQTIFLQVPRYMAVLFNLQKLFVAPVAVWHIFTFYVISHSCNSWFEVSNNLNLGFIAFISQLQCDLFMSGRSEVKIDFCLPRE